MKRFLAIWLVLLTACTQQGPALTPQASQVVPMKVRSVALTPEQKTYLARLKNASTMQPGGTRESYNLYGLSKSGRLNDVSRHIKLELTAVLAGLRVTGDPALLETTYQVMQNLRGTLALHGDPYLNWNYYNPGTGLHGKDTHVMEEIMGNATVAQGAWALKQNAGLASKYGEAAHFWTNYLENHFIAKWKQRSGRLTPPFLQKNLMHPFMDSIRLNHYLYKLTGKSMYLIERDRLVKAVKLELLIGPNENRYMFSHFINSLRRDPVFPLAHVNYGGESMTSIADLGFEFVFGEPMMNRFANTVTFMFDRGSPGIMKEAIGIAGTYYSPLLKKNVSVRPMSYPRGTFYSLEHRGYCLLTPWDETGEIESYCKRANQTTTPQPIVGVLIAR